MIDKVRMHVKGRCGWYPADNMTSGEFVLDKDGGDGAGQGMYGGTLYVKGDTNSMTGQIMKGGTIIVGGNSGFMTGLYMMGGRIIVLGDLGAGAGETIVGGRIFFAGKVAGLGKNAQVSPVDDGEVAELESVFRDCRIKADARSFSKITPKKGRPVYGN
jgi:glutamate synthase domain-containing protein 3